jgi:predicted deacylase
MKKLVHELQRLPQGDSLCITSYHFEGGLPGPKVYLQANIHGAEITGTFVLGKLINYLNNLKENFPGQVIIVPNANPIGLNDTGLSIQGRWNPKSGLNWNRVHLVESEFLRDEDYNLYYKNLLAKDNLSIEEKLTGTLHTISGVPDYVIDLHCAGYESINYLFTFDNVDNEFDLLDTKLQVLVDKTDFGKESFMTSYYLPFIKASNRPKVCTWEVAGDNQIDRHVAENRFTNLVDWLDSVWGKDIAVKTPSIKKKISDMIYFNSPHSGYFVWEKEVGEVVNKGEVWMTFYNPQSNEFKQYHAPKDLVFVSRYAIGAVGEGEQIGEYVIL